MPSEQELAEYHSILQLPRAHPLEQLDEQYFTLTAHWTSLARGDGAEEAALQLRRIDEAYLVLLSECMKDPVNLGSHDEEKHEFSMVEITNGKDRMIRPGTAPEKLWTPPLEELSSSIESEDGVIELPHRRSIRHFPKISLGIAPGFKLVEIVGDIKNAPDRAVIVHSVNCQGVWGYGIAAVLKRMLPEAYAVYKANCSQAKHPFDLLGSCLLIPPQPSDYEHQQKFTLKNKERVIAGTSILGRRRWLACLFTSVGYGKPNIHMNNPGKDPESAIIRNTQCALEELRIILEGFGPSNFDEKTAWKTDDEKPGELWSVKFNSGAFGVEWRVTKELLEDEFLNFERPWTVVDKSVSGNGQPPSPVPETKSPKVKEKLDVAALEASEATELERLLGPGS